MNYEETHTFHSCHPWATDFPSQFDVTLPYTLQGSEWTGRSDSHPIRLPFEVHSNWLFTYWSPLQSKLLQGKGFYFVRIFTPAYRKVPGTYKLFIKCLVNKWISIKSSEWRQQFCSAISWLSSLGVMLTESASRMWRWW